MILIGRGLDFRLERETDWMKEQRKPGQKLNQFDTLCGCQGAEEKRPPFPVAITEGFHLFPFRTQKLSPQVPKVLGW